MVRTMTILGLLLLASCNKENEPRRMPPTACLAADRTLIQPGETVTFTDCSDFAIQTMIYFPHEQDLADQTTGYVFDSDRRFKYVFNSKGAFAAVLQAIGASGTPIREHTVTVVVRD